MAALPTVAAGDLLATAGADDSIKDYIKARRINTTPTLALIAKDVEQFASQVIHPFNGTRIDGTDFKAEDGQHGVVTAIMTPVRGGLAAMGGGFPGPDIATGAAPASAARERRDDDSIHT